MDPGLPTAFSITFASQRWAMAVRDYLDARKERPEPVPAIAAQAVSAEPAGGTTAGPRVHAAADISSNVATGWPVSGCRVQPQQ